MSSEGAKKLTKRDRQIRKLCPFFEDMGCRGYKCNRNSFWSGAEPKEFATWKPYRRSKNCEGCPDMYKLTNTQK